MLLFARLPGAEARQGKPLYSGIIEKTYMVESPRRAGALAGAGVLLAADVAHRLALLVRPDGY